MTCAVEGVEDIGAVAVDRSLVRRRLDDGGNCHAFFAFGRLLLLRLIRGFFESFSGEEVHGGF